MEAVCTWLLAWLAHGPSLPALIMYIMFDPDDKDDTYMYLKQSSKDEYAKELEGNMDCMLMCGANQAS